MYRSVAQRIRNTWQVVLSLSLGPLSILSGHINKYSNDLLRHRAAAIQSLIKNETFHFILLTHRAELPIMYAHTSFKCARSLPDGNELSSAVILCNIGALAFEFGLKLVTNALDRE